MPVFNNESDFEVIREGEDITLRIDYEKQLRIPSLEDDPVCMSKTMDKLIEVKNVTKIVFGQRRDYEYDYNQTMLLVDIAHLYLRLIKEKREIGLVPSPAASRYIQTKYNELQHLIFNRLKSDPIGSYVELKRLLRRENIAGEQVQAQNDFDKKYSNILKKLIRMLEETKLIRIASYYIAGYKIGDRSIYRRIFNPVIKPDFMYTKLMAAYPEDAEELDSYNIGDTEVTIFALPDTVQNLYHIMPPEFKLSEEKYMLLDIARKILAEHKPKRSEFIDPDRMRSVFFNIGHDLLDELSSYHGIRIKEKELIELTNILIRYTVGFGLIEVLLTDEKVQDVTINSPMGQIPMFIVHADYTDCMTNIIPTMNEAESWASKLRMVSERPLDEANPILDTEISIPQANARVAVIAPPLNPSGLAFAFRRHRDKPWTLPLFMKNRMINALGAGIISFLVDGSRTMLVAGTRSAGKTSLLGSVLTEIMRKYRIITIEDTLELPTTSLRKLGYNIQPMKVASALAKNSAEVPADEGIRTTLRLGDSCLIVGEVRSTEASALYEAMRVGALANVVAGTIHGDSPYGVFDRVVNDLKVPRTSFKATDIIIVANPIKSADGLHRWRRITQITEVRKLWENDPLEEHGFVDLMKYNSMTDQLEPSDDLINGDSDVIKSIASNVKDWAGNWDAVWENIQLRAKIKETIVKTSEKINDPDLLEAPFVIQCNDEFHRISDRVKETTGSLDPDRIFFDWNEWLNRTIKRRRLNKDE
ncbi:MAG: ATPase, T2SS/T4P/T4SS family [Candidatus Woesearchaeota archaeon]